MPATAATASTGCSHGWQNTNQTYIDNYHYTGGYEGAVNTYASDWTQFRITGSGFIYKRVDSFCVTHTGYGMTVQSSSWICDSTGNPASCSYSNSWVYAGFSVRSHSFPCYWVDSTTLPGFYFYSTTRPTSKGTYGSRNCDIY